MVRSVSFVHSLLFDAQIAQSVEQRIENPCVPGSIPGLSTITQWCALYRLSILFFLMLR